MARGPKPAPSAVVEQKRAIRSSRKPQVGAKALDNLTGVQAPDWLKAEGLAVWERLAPSLTAAKLLSVTDVTAFGRYCKNFARWLKMQEVLDDPKMTETYSVTTASGTVHRPRPEFMVADRLERQLVAAEDRFGLNPAERQRIMAARAQSGVTGDLFGQQQKPAPEQKPAPAPRPRMPSQSPVGFLQ